MSCLAWHFEVQSSVDCRRSRIGTVTVKGQSIDMVIKIEREGHTSH